MTDQIKFGRLHRVCPDCGFIHFDDPKVAVVAFVEQNQRVLLVRRAMHPERNLWALPGGFVDYGEDPREAAIREVREETNLDVRVTRLIGVNGGKRGSGSASIVIIYAAEVIGGTAEARDDADAFLWYAASDPLPEIAFESTRSLLDEWVRQQISACRRSS
jgi:ADP-ribose pyrophosphatase YjhB (NUDIX family)